MTCSNYVDLDPNSLIFINCHRFSTPAPLTYSSFENRLPKKVYGWSCSHDFSYSSCSYQYLFIWKFHGIFHGYSMGHNMALTWHNLHILHFQFLRASQSGFSFLQWPHHGASVCQCTKKSEGTELYWHVPSLVAVISFIFFKHKDFKGSWKHMETNQLKNGDGLRWLFWSFFEESSLRIRGRRSGCSGCAPPFSQWFPFPAGA